MSGTSARMREECFSPQPRRTCTCGCSTCLLKQCGRTGTTSRARREHRCQLTNRRLYASWLVSSGTNSPRMLERPILPACDGHGSAGRSHRRRPSTANLNGRRLPRRVAIRRARRGAHKPEPELLMQSRTGSSTGENSTTRGEAATPPEPRSPVLHRGDAADEDPQRLAGRKARKVRAAWIRDPQRCVVTPATSPGTPATARSAAAALGSAGACPDADLGGVGVPNDTRDRPVTLRRGRVRIARRQRQVELPAAIRRCPNVQRAKRLLGRLTAQPSEKNPSAHLSAPFLATCRRRRNRLPTSLVDARSRQPFHRVVPTPITPSFGAR
jgi:hypothetical protein